MKKIILSGLIVLISWLVNAQVLTVFVVDEQQQPVEYATVSLEGVDLNLTTDADSVGVAHFSSLPHGSYRVKASFPQIVGEEKLIEWRGEDLSVTLQLLDVLDEVVISGTLTEISKKNSPVAVTVLTPQFFAKNPEPTIYQLIDQVNGVRTQVNCNVCNTGDIHINGMEGPYTMITIDGMPIVGGLSTVYGLQGIPASLIERVEVIKGPASTLYGSEAVGGLINVITKSPSWSDPITVNGMMSSWQEANLELGLTKKWGKVSTILGANYFKYGHPIDNNNDNFTDLTLQDRISLFNKWSFQRKEDRVANFAARYVYEDRWGGELQWTPEFRGGDSIYGESIYTSRLELFGNYQFPLKEKVMWQASFSHHDQNSVYGDTWYLAQQQILFNQLFWTHRYGKHNILAGAAHRYTYYDDNTVATEFTSTENNPSKTNLPGLFAQDLIDLSDRSQLLLGTRLDVHNQHGPVLSPRLNYKYSPTSTFDARLSLGNGFRVVSVFTEDHAALTGARKVIIANNLNPEQSYNASLNLTKRCYPRFGNLTVDANLFYTYFSNKINPDYATNDDQIIYDNLDGHAIYRGANIDLRLQCKIPLTLNLGFTILDAFEVNKQADGSTQKETPLLTESFSGSFSASYKFRKPQISLDYSGVFYGPMHLPVLENDFRSDRSETYFIHNVKVSKDFGKSWSVYAGVKNLFNFTPPANSIMRPFDPFDRTADDPIANPKGYTFDPSYVYAPNQGIRAYLGATYRLTR